MAKEYTIKFEYLSALHFHLKQWIGEKINIDDHFKNSSKSGSTVELLAPADCPVYTIYKTSTGMLFLSAHYQIKSKYGVVCSF